MLNGQKTLCARGAPRKQIKAGAHEVFAHMGRPGPCAVISCPCRRKRHMAIFAMQKHSKIAACRNFRQAAWVWGWDCEAQTFLFFL